MLVSKERQLRSVNLHALDPKRGQYLLSVKKEILWLFLGTRLLLFLMTYLSFYFFQPKKEINFIALLTSWNHWDAQIYTRIAQSGYTQQWDFAFFPLFPLIVRLLAIPFGHPAEWVYLLIGMLVSNAALLGALYIIHQFTIEYCGEQVSQRTTLFLTIFPTAFFFFAAYNESLFLMLSAATLLALRHQRWWLAGLFGFLGILSRSTGAIVGVVFLYELWLKRDIILETKKRFLNSVTPILLLPLGLLLYSLFCWQRTGNPLYFVTVQAHWSRQTSWPWQGIIQNLLELFWNQPFGSFNEVHVLLDLTATLAFIVLIFLGRRRLPVSLTLWTSLLMLYYLISPSIWQHDGLISNQRFVLEMFPAFITLAIISIKRPRLYETLLWVLPALMTLLSVLFVLGKWMV